MSWTIRKIGYLFASIFAAVPLYIVLHEGGHALIAVLCGARITEFSVTGAYMRYEGGIFTAAALSLFHIAGMLLPALAAILYMLAYRSRGKGLFYRIFSLIFLLMPVCSILAWVIVPVLSLLNRAPQSDDAAKFLASSGLNPWAVLSGAAILFSCCLLIAWKKKIPQNYWAAIRSEGAASGDPG